MVANSYYRGLAVTDAIFQRGLRALPDPGKDLYIETVTLWGKKKKAQRELS